MASIVVRFLSSFAWNAAFLHHLKQHYLKFTAPSTSVHQDVVLCQIKLSVGFAKTAQANEELQFAKRCLVFVEDVAEKAALSSVVSRPYLCA